MAQARFTTKSLTQEMKKRFGNEYEFLDPYKSLHTPMGLKHTPCGTIYLATVSKFLDFGCKRCKVCKHKEDSNRFFNYVKDNTNNEYTFLGPYVNIKTPIRVRHNVCGCEYNISPNQFMTHGSRCEKCSHKLTGEKNREPINKVKDRVNAIHNRGYTFVNTYFENGLRMLTVTHKECGTTYSTRADTFFRGSQCKKCLYKSISKKYTKTTKEYADEVTDVTDGEYSLIGEYVNTNTKVTLKHNLCGNIYQVFPYQFKRGKRCPDCSSMSYGEHYIEKILKKHKIKFSKQVEFKDCKDIHQLSYDFKVNNFLIEYQGQQHYHPVELFGGKKQFLVQQEHDTIKRKYAVENGYTLIEVPYTKSSIKDIESFLISKNVIA